jgi:hypothetical protein
MKRIAQSVVALLLTTGLAFGGFASGLGGGMSVKGGGIGCCRDAI